jgi:AcrR family transcriptional regulator
MKAVTSWKEHRESSARDHIVDVAMELLCDTGTETFSHEAIARRAGMGTRTVYRYFPHRADLMQVLWERVREQTKTRFPEEEADILPLVHEAFGNFNEHEALVRASLDFSGSIELRARGSLQGRPAFRKSLASTLAELPPKQQRRVVAVALSIWSAPFWQLLRDRGELTGEEAQEAGVWAMETILKAARAETKVPPDSQEPKPKLTARTRKGSPK